MYPSHLWLLTTSEQLKIWAYIFHYMIVCSCGLFVAKVFGCGFTGSSWTMVS